MGQGSIEGYIKLARINPHAKLPPEKGCLYVKPGQWVLIRGGGGIGQDGGLGGDLMLNFPPFLLLSDCLSRYEKMTKYVSI